MRPCVLFRTKVVFAACHSLPGHAKAGGRKKWPRTRPHARCRAENLSRCARASRGGDGGKRSDHHPGTETARCDRPRSVRASEADLAEARARSADRPRTAEERRGGARGDRQDQAGDVTVTGSRRLFAWRRSDIRARIRPQGGARIHGREARERALDGLQSPSGGRGGPSRRSGFSCSSAVFPTVCRRHALRLAKRSFLATPSSYQTFRRSQAERSVGVFCRTYKFLGPLFEPIVSALRELPGVGSTACSAKCAC